MQNQPSLGRRGFLGASAATGAAAVTLTAAPAHAGTHSYGKTPLPTAKERHFISRLTYGYSLAALEDLRAAGGPEAWLEAQLNPDSVPESALGKQCDSWWESTSLSHRAIAQRNADQSEPGWVAMANYARWTLVKRIESQRQLLERMTEVWEEHLYIPRNDDAVFPYRIQFGQRLKELALTSFEELLLMSTTHPAMGVSLDNSRSQKKAVNENLGRELLELHTVGQGAYTEDDVKASARMLTGYRVDTWGSWDYYYESSWHHTGALRILDFTHQNSNPDGREATTAYLKYLAHHPRTARNVCRKLALRFVSDRPSDALIEAMTQVYLREGTKIKPVLRYLFASNEFLNSGDKKVKSPTDELTSLYRALGVKLHRPTRDESGANAFLWVTENLGQMPFDWPRPDGPPPTGEAWLSPSRFLSSWDIHWGAAGGWWPSKEITWITPLQRLPENGISLGKLVDSLSRSMLGEEASDTLLKAVATSTEVSLSSNVTRDSSIVSWKMPHVLALILNQPSFYLR